MNWLRHLSASPLHLICKKNWPKQIMVRGFFLLFLGGLVFAFPVYGGDYEGIKESGQSVLPKAELVIFSNHKPRKILANFNVELATTPEAMRYGLMFRRILGENDGMLFVITPPRAVRFWMRHTFVPLDMIFIKPSGEIESIVTRHDTRSDIASYSKGAVGYVLEIGAGQAGRRGIKVGDFIHLPEGQAAE